MTAQRDDWFPTPIWHFDIPNYEQLNEKLLQAIYDENKKDNQGLSWSNGLGWHSKDYLHQHPAFQAIAKITVNNALESGQEIGFDLNRFTMIIANCWAVINPKLAFNFVHNHPNSLLSAVYYVKAAENSGGIFFRDPRDVAHMFMPALTELTPWTIQKITYRATEGKMIIFPSWLNHGVEPNLSEEDRVCISFNISMTHKSP
ncbi:MAG: hypothetical protein DCF19_08540 [Pseudanabaena frigida]|uniref:Fe2OG dioxygenase domain-containing protein n=1 Tax=Pseudanabaena frigida TaxID=945775 RepID=A0A2W4WAL5_9CYAN|nr:MAG: hypothetical protein DCF19_08540 [Pseudanabaena frigida]